MMGQRDWFHLVQDGEKGRYIVIKVMILLVP
jgi:hypothetical protein